MKLSLKNWLLQATQTLASTSPSPRLDAELLLSHVLNCSRSYLYTWPETELIPLHQQQLQNLLQRRAQGEPIAYLTGEREFWSLPLQVSAATLIPRPETELLVEQALAILPQQPCTIVDLGTGGGAIALALAKERPDGYILAGDYSHAALAIAQKNAQRLNLANIGFYQGDWLTAVAAHSCDLVIANPPYVEADSPELGQGDVRFEPRHALISPNQGLADLSRIVQQSPHYLIAGGWLLLEHGYQQGKAVRQLLERAGFSAIATITDLAGLERVSLGQLSDHADGV